MATLTCCTFCRHRLRHDKPAGKPQDTLGGKPHPTSQHLYVVMAQQAFSQAIRPSDFFGRSFAASWVCVDFAKNKHNNSNKNVLETSLTLENSFKKIFMSLWQK